MDPAPLDPECSAARDDLAALAIGTLTGRERAELLDHLERCARCAAELEELSAAADALVTLIPAARAARWVRRPHDGDAACRAQRAAAGVLAESRGRRGGGRSGRGRWRGGWRSALVFGRCPSGCWCAHRSPARWAPCRGDGRVITWALRMAGHDPRRRAYLGRRHLFGHPCRWLSCGGWAFPPFGGVRIVGGAASGGRFFRAGGQRARRQGQDGRMGPFGLRVGPTSAASRLALSERTGLGSYWALRPR